MSALLYISCSGNCGGTMWWNATWHYLHTTCNEPFVNTTERREILMPSAWPLLCNLLPLSRFSYWCLIHGMNRTECCTNWSRLWLQHKLQREECFGTVRCSRYEGLYNAVHLLTYFCLWMFVLKWNSRIQEHIDVSCYQGGHIHTQWILGEYWMLWNDMWFTKIYHGMYFSTITRIPYFFLKRFICNSEDNKRFKLSLQKIWYINVYWNWSMIFAMNGYEEVMYWDDTEVLVYRYKRLHWPPHFFFHFLNEAEALSSYPSVP